MIIQLQILIDRIWWRWQSCVSLERSRQEVTNSILLSADADLLSQILSLFHLLSSGSGPNQKLQDEKLQNSSVEVSLNVSGVEFSPLQVREAPCSFLLLLSVLRSYWFRQHPPNQIPQRTKSPLKVPERFTAQSRQQSMTCSSSRAKVYQTFCRTPALLCRVVAHDGDTSPLSRGLLTYGKIIFARHAGHLFTWKGRWLISLVPLETPVCSIKTDGMFTALRQLHLVNCVLQHCAHRWATGNNSSQELHKQHNFLLQSIIKKDKMAYLKPTLSSWWFKLTHFPAGTGCEYNRVTYCSVRDANSFTKPQ